MGRADNLIMKATAQQVEEVEGEVEALSFRPADIPDDVWQLIQENGKLATERLNEILKSPRFMRLRASDQAKLISLAQNRAYGAPKQNKAEAQRSGALTDATAQELRNLDNRSRLPEYKKLLKSDIEDAEIIK